MTVFYSHLQRYRTIQATRRNCSNFWYCLFALSSMAFYKNIIILHWPVL